MLFIHFSAEESLQLKHALVLTRQICEGEIKMSCSCTLDFNGNPRFGK